MGNRPIRKGTNGENGAKGAYVGKHTTQTRNQLREVAWGYMYYLRQSDVRVNGYTYGSENLYIQQESLTVLYAEIQRRYMETYGVALSATPADVATAWKDVRKRNYKTLRDQTAITTDPQLRLFDNDDDRVQTATVYAYWGRNQIADKRLVKIGYTSEPVAVYLHRLKRQYDPLLLATKCGGRQEEKKEHGTWARFLAEGNEWFTPSPLMFRTFESEWDLAAGYNTLKDEILAGLDC